MLSVALPGLKVERTGAAVRVGGQVPEELLASLRDHLIKAMP